MSEGSNERGQVWGIVVASDRSPPLSPALALPPGQPDGHGTVRPHQFSNTVMSPQNPLNRHATQDPRLESSDPSSASHIAFSPTSLEEVAAQQSMMAADQLGREEPRAIRHATVEIHGRLPAQVSERLAGPDDGDTSPADGGRVSCSTDPSPPQNLVFGHRGGDSGSGQTVLTPIGMMAFGDTVIPVESGDEESGGVTLANNKDADISHGREVQDAFIGRDASQSSLCTTHFSSASNSFSAAQLATHSLSTSSCYDYSDPPQPTIDLQSCTPSYETGVVYYQHNSDQPSNIIEGWEFQHGPSQTAIQKNNISNAGLYSIDSGHCNLSAHDGNPSSSAFTSVHTSDSTTNLYDQLGSQRLPDLSHVAGSHENSLLVIASGHDSETSSFNAGAGTGTSNELDMIDAHLQTSPESTQSTEEDSEDITANTGANIHMVDDNQSPSQDHDSIIPSDLQQLQQTTPVSSQLLPGGFTLQYNFDGADVDPLDIMVDDFERNLDVSTLLEHWTISYGMRKSEFPPIGERALRVKEWKRPVEVQTKDLDGDFCDPQGINWVKLGTTRANARTVRNKLYVNYTNIKHACPSEYAQDIRESENYFRFRRTDTQKMASLSHFQLRNLVSATSKNDVYYAGRSKILSANRSLGAEHCIMDFTTSDHHSDYSGRMKVSTLAAGHGVLIAGGFGGEYAMKGLTADFDSKHTEGLVTDHDNGITNHVHTISNRLSGLPQAIFASNDCSIRTLDCNTNTFINEHSYHWAVNCTATSPDGRLRVVVGDTRHGLICNADTGHAIEKLQNHQDYGFACAWADDGIHVATGNQDATVQIWDARMWSRPLQIIASEIAGVRSLRFSPVGGGRRVLLMAEPADIISVVDAESFQSKQRLDVFGEIGGISFTPDGSEFFVAITDRRFGGIMEYERIGHGEKYGMRYLRQREIEDAGDEYYDEKAFEWIADQELDDDDRVETTWAQRSRRGLGLDSMIL